MNEQILTDVRKSLSQLTFRIVLQLHCHSWIQRSVKHLTTDKGREITRLTTCRKNCFVWEK